MIVKLVKFAFYLAVLVLVVATVGGMVLLSLVNAAIDGIQGAPAG